MFQLSLQLLRGLRYVDSLKDNWREIPCTINHPFPVFCPDGDIDQNNIKHCIDMDDGCRSDKYWVLGNANGKGSQRSHIRGRADILICYV